MKRKKFFKAQSTMEYAIVLAVVVAAFTVMQVYIKRGMQGRIRDLADQISPAHYEPGRTESNYTTTQSGTTFRQYVNGMIIISQGADPNQGGNIYGAPEKIEKTGYERVYPEVE